MDYELSEDILNHMPLREIISIPIACTNTQTSSLISLILSDCYILQKTKTITCNL